MHLAKPKKIVLLGMMTKIPVAGEVWQVIHYLLGFRRLGFDVYYVEAHGRTPSMLMEQAGDDGSARAAEFIDRVLRPFGFGDKWCFHALHDEGRCYGITKIELQALYDAADLLINHHGGTAPLPEHYATDRLIYLQTDPVELEIKLHNNNQHVVKFLQLHRAIFTWGENYGNGDCQLPVSERFQFLPTRAPVVCDLWQNGCSQGGETFTTIGNWRQPWRMVKFQGQVYSWSKHHEYLKFLDLPSRADQPFELALGSFEPLDQLMLEQHGWRVRRALDFSTDLDSYRDYIRHSRGEFTVAKDQNVRLRSGWFSERSAQYLAAGRPVITQETGFSNVLPTGRGLFAFSTMDDILSAVDSINSDYETHCRAAAEIAREYFSYEKVLGRMLTDIGV